MVKRTSASLILFLVFSPVVMLFQNCGRGFQVVDQASVLDKNQNQNTNTNDNNNQAVKCSVDGITLLAANEKRRVPPIKNGEPTVPIRDEKEYRYDKMGKGYEDRLATF